VLDRDLHRPVRSRPRTLRSRGSARATSSCRSPGFHQQAHAPPSSDMRAHPPRARLQRHARGRDRPEPVAPDLRASKVRPDSPSSTRAPRAGTPGARPSASRYASAGRSASADATPSTFSLRIDRPREEPRTVHSAPIERAAQIVRSSPAPLNVALYTMYARSRTQLAPPNRPALRLLDRRGRRHRTLARQPQGLRARPTPRTDARPPARSSCRTITEACDPTAPTHPRRCSAAPQDRPARRPDGSCVRAPTYAGTSSAGIGPAGPSVSPSPASTFVGSPTALERVPCADRLARRSQGGYATRSPEKLIRRDQVVRRATVVLSPPRASSSGPRPRPSTGARPRRSPRSSFSRTVFPRRARCSRRRARGRRPSARWSRRGCRR
jgi:hypothetical protein